MTSKLSTEDGETTYEELHFGDFLVNLLHELDDEVDQLVLQHGLCVEIGYEERNVIALSSRCQRLPACGD